MDRDESDETETNGDKESEVVEEAGGVVGAMVSEAGPGLVHGGEFANNSS